MITFNAVFGVAPGYDKHSSQMSTISAEGLVATCWKKFMTLEWEDTNILVSATCTGTKVVYPEKFGCPESGETAVQVVGVLNPKFKVPETAWKEACKRIVENVKKELAQERVTLYFQRVEELHYLE